MEPILCPTPQEEPLLEELIELASQVTSDPQYLNRDNFLRVLRARELKPKPAFEMWQKWYEWRQTYQAHTITEEEMLPQLRTGKAFFHGQDNQGRPCLIVRIRYHRPEQFSTEETMRLVIYLVEKGVKIADERGVGQICVIYDRGQATAENKDNKMIGLGRSLAGMLQDFYAERLGAVYVLHVNWLYWLIFQMIKPLLHKKTREKVHIIKNNNGLKDFFSMDQLTREYGGEDEYIHPYPEEQ